MLVIAGVIIVGGALAYKLHITSIGSLKTAVSGEVAKLEASVAKVEPVIKAELVAAVAKIKSLL